MQGRPMTSQEKFVFNQILNTAGAISPLQMPDDAPQAPQINPAVSKVGGTEQLAGLMK
jgi:hypothetical protein